MQVDGSDPDKTTRAPATRALDHEHATPAWRRIALCLVGATALLTLVGIAANTEPFDLEINQAPPAANDGAATSSGGGATTPSAPIADDGTEATPVPDLPRWLLWAIGVPAAFGALWLLAKQRVSMRMARRRSAATPLPQLDQHEHARAIANFADDLIAELELDVEPRLAIQRSYAAVETGFGNRELRRKPAETPLRYLDRIFGRRAATGDALTRLTELFQLARFSDEPVDEPMRADAIESLRTLRDHYRSLGRARVGQS